jgi:hypothetical protein
VLVHAAPRHLEVVVRNDQGDIVAEGRGLRRSAPGPMSLLIRDGAAIRLQDHRPTSDDLGVLVILAVRDYIDAIAPGHRPLFDRLHRLVLEATLDDHPAT